MIPKFLLVAVTWKNLCSFKVNLRGVSYVFRYSCGTDK